MTAAIADSKVIAPPHTLKPKIYQGENFDVQSAKGQADFQKLKQEAHPVLKARIEKQKVVDKEITGLYLHNHSLLDSQYPTGIPKMCDHCVRILEGIDPVKYE